MLELVGPGALEQARHQAEDGRRVPLRGRWLAYRQADFALRHRVAGHGVHHEQNVVPGVAEELRYRHGHLGSLDPLQGGLVRGGDDHHRLPQPLLAKTVLDELQNLFAALSDEGDDVEVRRRVSGNHAKQRALADAAACEYAHSLASSARQDRVDATHAGVERLLDAPPAHRVGGGAPHVPALAGRRGEVVGRPADAVDHAPKQLLSDADREALAFKLHPVAALHAVDGVERKQKYAVVAESYDLGLAGGHVPGARLDGDEVANRGHRTVRLDSHADDFSDVAQRTECVDFGSHLV